MDNLTPQQRKKNMQRIRSKNTKPEVVLRKALFKLGVRYRIHAKNIFGKPDIYIKKYKLAIFVDSDFWHGRLYKKGKAIPKSNQEYWNAKLERNIKRDKDVNEKLRKDGWTVLRFWEKDIYQDASSIANKIKETIADLRNSK